MVLSCGFVLNVIIFNYDDILEIYFSFFGYICEFVIDGVMWVFNKDVVVYYFYGFMLNDFIKLI